MNNYFVGSGNQFSVLSLFNLHLTDKGDEEVALIFPNIEYIVFWEVFFSNMACKGQLGLL